MESLKGLGSLRVLPMEIRDHIYRHVFHDRYLVPCPGAIFYLNRGYPGFEMKRSVYYDQFPCTNIGLLETSKALRSEAEDVFYAESVFVFAARHVLEDTELLWDVFNLRNRHCPKALKLLCESMTSYFPPLILYDAPEVKFRANEWGLERMNNIEIQMDFGDYLTCPRTDREPQPVDIFNMSVFKILESTDLTRATCHIICENLQACQYVEHTLLSAPYYESLKKLVTLKTLVLEFKFDGTSEIHRCITRSDRTIQQKLDALLFESLRGSVFDEVATDLATSVGLPTIWQDGLSISLRYHPRKQLEDLSCSKKELSLSQVEEPAK